MHWVYQFPSIDFFLDHSVSFTDEISVLIQRVPPFIITLMGYDTGSLFGSFSSFGTLLVHLVHFFRIIRSSRSLDNLVHLVKWTKAVVIQITSCLFLRGRHSHIRWHVKKLNKHFLTYKLQDSQNFTGQFYTEISLICLLRFALNLEILSFNQTEYVPVHFWNYSVVSYLVQLYLSTTLFIWSELSRIIS